MPTDRPNLTCAVATPLRADLTVHHELLLAHARDLLARGCDGLAVFGTSGEGPCLCVADRRAGLEFLLEAGVAPDRLVVGVGSACLADAAELTRHALSVGVPDTLLMPAFFLRAAATEEGVFRFFAEVIERAADPKLRLLLYNFPAISGVLLSVELIGRLRRDVRRGGPRHQGQRRRFCPDRRLPRGVPRAHDLYRHRGQRPADGGEGRYRHDLRPGQCVAADHAPLSRRVRGRGAASSRP